MWIKYENKSVGTILHIVSNFLRMVKTAIAHRANENFISGYSQYWPIGQYWQVETRKIFKFPWDATREAYAFGISSVW